MRSLGKTVSTGAVATVTSALALYAARPHFDQMLSVLSAWLRTPVAYTSFLAVWAGWFALGQVRVRLKYGHSYESGWGTLAWLLSGLAFAGGGLAALFALAARAIQ